MFLTRDPGLLRWTSRWAEIWVDTPADTGCWGVMLRLAQLRMSVTWPAKSGPQDWPPDQDPLLRSGPLPPDCP